MNAKNKEIKLQWISFIATLGILFMANANMNLNLGQDKVLEKIKIMEGYKEFQEGVFLKDDLTEYWSQIYETTNVHYFSTYDSQYDKERIEEIMSDLKLKYLDGIPNIYFLRLNSKYFVDIYSNKFDGFYKDYSRNIYVILNQNTKETLCHEITHRWIDDKSEIAHDFVYDIGRSYACYYDIFDK